MRTIKTTIELIKEAEGKESIWGALVIMELASLIGIWTYMMYFM